ncbi:hypothetical protein AABD41_14970 [Staphylococcus pseudoxylosus]|uniref:hypothetical protein n=1 Tax=Staphylococcus pseudoxylosus TaxID=2282419 RepID=UPI00398AC511
MKIKVKKQLNLPQLIKWAWDNGVRDSEFQTVENERGISYEACFSEDGNFYSNDELDSKDTFTVEVEEEITEDTEFGKLYYTTILSRIVESSCTTIQSSLKHIAVEPIAFYILNDDLTMTLIWREGKLVE